MWRGARSVGKGTRKVARFFPFMLSAARNTWLEMHHDDASANRPAVPYLRESVSIAGSGVDEFIRWQAHRFSRASCGYPAAAVSDPHVQPVRVLGIGA